MQEIKNEIFLADFYLTKNDIFLLILLVGLDWKIIVISCNFHIFPKKEEII